MKRSFVIFYTSLLNMVFVHAQYIHEVLEYKPAPGQFINAGPWGGPGAGDPASTTSIIGRLDGAMSLGAFGGYVIFRFEEPVENHPSNPYGVDFVIYGNPLQNLSNPEIDNRVAWSEPGIVSVMKDANRNGLPDDTWYELAGSDYFFSTTIKDYEVTYTNPGTENPGDVPWTDNRGNSGAVLVNAFHTQPYYPLPGLFPGIDSVSYALSGSRIRDHVDRSNPSFISSAGRPWGYADNTLRSIYNGLPDNPYTGDVEEGSGGDAFDIDWAVDTGGNYIDLDTIDFVKVHNGVLADAGWLGEVSTEITGAFDVEPDPSVSGSLDMIIIGELPDTIRSASYPLEAFVFHKGRKQSGKKIRWTSNLPEATVDQNHVLTLSGSGTLNLTAALEDNPEVTASVSTVVDVSQDPSTGVSPGRMIFSLYPNPASDHIRIEGPPGTVSVSIYSPVGICRLTIDRYTEGKIIDITALPPGLYLARVREKNILKTIRFVKR